MVGGPGSVSASVRLLHTYIHTYIHTQLKKQMPYVKEGSLRLAPITICCTWYTYAIQPSSLGHSSQSKC